MNKFLVPGAIAAGVVGLGALAFSPEEPKGLSPTEFADLKETLSEEKEPLDVSAFEEDTPQTTRSYSSGDRDCGDFSSQSEAQDFFESEGSGDPHGLDRDDDGIACETL